MTAKYMNVKKMMIAETNAISNKSKHIHFLNWKTFESDKC